MIKQYFMVAMKENIEERRENGSLWKIIAMTLQWIWHKAVMSSFYLSNILGILLSRLKIA